jgi:hypothetical protein
VLREVRLIEETCLNRDVRDWVTLCKQLLGKADTYEEVVCVWGEADLFAEHTGEMKGAQAYLLRKLLQRYVYLGKRVKVLSRQLHRLMLPANPTQYRAFHSMPFDQSGKGIEQARFSLQRKSTTFKHRVRSEEK